MPALLRRLIQFYKTDEKNVFWIVWEYTFKTIYLAFFAMLIGVAYWTILEGTETHVIPVLVIGTILIVAYQETKEDFN